MDKQTIIKYRIFIKRYYEGGNVLGREFCWLEKTFTERSADNPHGITEEMALEIAGKKGKVQKETIIRETIQ